MLELEFEGSRAGGSGPPSRKSDRIRLGMRSPYPIALGSFLLLAVVFAAAQSASLPAPPSAASVVFKFNWDQGRPWVDYSITVGENGATHFRGEGNAIESGDDDSFQQDFTMTEPNRQKIFEMAKAANYFQGQFEAKQKNIAKTGTKTLEYQGPSGEHAATYNYSPNQNIQQLTKLFQSIAITLDYGRKLAYQYRFDKLGMDTRLKELADMQTSGYVEELQAIEPILRKIRDDPNMMHIARLEAQQLLHSLPGASASNQATQSRQP